MDIVEYGYTERELGAELDMWKYPPVLFVSVPNGFDEQQVKELKRTVTLLLEPSLSFDDPGLEVAVFIPEGTRIGELKQGVTVDSKHPNRF